METDEDDIGVEEICEELIQTATQLKAQIDSCTDVYNQLCCKISGNILKPKTASVKKWLKALGLPDNGLTYDDFLDTFLGLYEEECRMDFATRSLVLRPQDAKIFKLDGTVTIYALLGAFPNVFT